MTVDVDGGLRTDHHRGWIDGQLPMTICHWLEDWLVGIARVGDGYLGHTTVVSQCDF